MSKSSERKSSSQPESPRHLKVRVQNICCAKEANLIIDNLNGVKGVKHVSVNTVGRTAFITHDENRISSTSIMERLNKLHLGISVIEDGEKLDETYKSGHNTFVLKIVNVVIIAILFVTVVALGQDSATAKWLAIPIFIFGGLPLAWKMVKDFQRCLIINMNLIMFVAVVGTLLLNKRVESLTILFVFSLAEVLETACRYKVEKDIAGLMQSVPETAVLAATNEEVRVEMIPVGTEIFVTAGERIPLDGDVMKGKASVDESSITGESTPVEKKIESSVYSGTFLLSGYLKIKTSCDFSTSTVSRVLQLVEEAHSQSSRMEELVNKFAKYYSPAIIFVAALFSLIPFILYKTDKILWSTFHGWVVRSLIILLVACPCAFIMATPIPMICGITKAAKMGALIKGGAYLETLAKVNLMVFDKTGTLTEGRFQVVHDISYDDQNRDRNIKFVISMETKSSHPLAACIVGHFAGCLGDRIDQNGVGLDLKQVKNFKNESGMGLSGFVAEHQVLIGNTGLMETFGVHVDDVYIAPMFKEFNENCTIVYVAVDGQISMVLALSDKCRSSSRHLIQELTTMGIESVMLTGDAEGPAHYIQKEIQISECFYSMTPNDKYNWIANQRTNSTTDKKRKNLVIAMIGDGVNDCPSLALADVGIAIGSFATALAVKTADVSLMSDDLSKLLDLIRLAQHCLSVIFQSIVGAVLIKVGFVLAALFYHNTLWLAVLADVLGLIFVSVNGVRPLSWKPQT